MLHHGAGQSHGDRAVHLPGDDRRIDFGAAIMGDQVAPDRERAGVATKLENTHRTEFRELLYPWHQWFGLRVGVHAAIERSGGTVFRCNLSGSDADRWLEVPAWMFDQSACARVRVAAGAHVDLAALTALAALLLRHVLNNRFASSNAQLSGV